VEGSLLISFILFSFLSPGPNESAADNKKQLSVLDDRSFGRGLIVADSILPLKITVRQYGRNTSKNAIVFLKFPILQR